MDIYFVSSFSNFSQFVIRAFNKKEDAVEYVKILLNEDKYIALFDNYFFVNLVKENCYLIDKIKVF